jgi:tetratricopeptide (TPR) repeat protein
VILDSGAFIALEKRDPVMTHLVERLSRETTPLPTSAGVVAEVWRGGGCADGRVGARRAAVRVGERDEAVHGTDRPGALRVDSREAAGAIAAHGAGRAWRGDRAVSVERSGRAVSAGRRGAHGTRGRSGGNGLAVGRLAFFRQQFAEQLVFDSQHADATARMEALLTAQPGFPPAHGLLWMIFFREQRYDEALPHARPDLTVRGYAEAADVLAASYPAIGYAGAMRRAADAIAAQSGRRYVSPLMVARLYAQAGDDTDALAWLERAVDERDTQVVYAAVGAEFAALHDHPRFREAMRRVNLPW